VRDPSVLLLDEATSALDPESERLVEASLRRASHNRTILLTTHSTRFAEVAERVVVMRDGAVAEQGSRAELISAQGLFYRMREAAAGRATAEECIVEYWDPRPRGSVEGWVERD
jgi:ABC-type multidrug transport system fused ATPase/permease subunit